MREELIASGVKFLQHPSVQHTSLSERITFLERKGLEKEETEEALKRYQSDTSQAIDTERCVNTSENTIRPFAAALPIVYGPRQHRKTGFLANIAYSIATISSFIGAVSILIYAWNLAVQLGYLPQRFSLSGLFSRTLESETLVADQIKEEKEESALVRNELKELTRAIQSQTDKVSELCRMLKDAARSNAVEHTHSISDSVVQEHLSIKQAIAAPENTYIENVLATLKKVEEANSQEVLKEASSLLMMYVKNIIDNPDVPRYRKIAPGNINFKNKIVPVQHHRELLGSIGFQPNGMNLEFRTEDKAKSICILKAFMKALQILHDADAITEHSLHTITKTAHEEVMREQSDCSGTDCTQSVHDIACDVAVNGAPKDNLQDFFRKLELNTAETGNTVLPVSEDIEPPSQKSFAEIMELVTSGQDVPDVECIEEKLSMDSKKCLEEMQQATAAQKVRLKSCVKRFSD